MELGKKSYFAPFYLILHISIVVSLFTQCGKYMHSLVVVPVMLKLNSFAGNLHRGFRCSNYVTIAYLSSNFSVLSRMYRLDDTYVDVTILSD